MTALKPPLLVTVQALAIAQPYRPAKFFVRWPVVDLRHRVLSCIDALEE
jgi:hypothetical protein